MAENDWVMCMYVINQSFMYCILQLNCWISCNVGLGHAYMLNITDRLRVHTNNYINVQYSYFMIRYNMVYIRALKS